MLDVDPSVVVGVSGTLKAATFGEFDSTQIIQILRIQKLILKRFLTLAEIYIVFASNGMVDTEAIRQKLNPVTFMSGA